MGMGCGMQAESARLTEPAASTRQGRPQQAAGSISSPGELLAHQSTCSLAASAEVLQAPRAGMGVQAPVPFSSRLQLSLPTLLYFLSTSPSHSLPLTFCSGYPKKLKREHSRPRGSLRKSAIPQPQHL